MINFLSMGLGGRLALRETPVGDRLPYSHHVDARTVRTRDGLLMQTIRLDGFPFETVDDDELNYRRQVRETLLRGAASARLALYHHVIRRPVAPIFGGECDDDFSQRLDRRWQDALIDRRLFANELYLTLVRRPLRGKTGFLAGLLGRAGAAEADEAEDLRQLDAAREAFVSTLAPYGARVLETYEEASGLASEPCSFLASLVNGQMRPILLPQGDIGHAIGDRRLAFGFDAMEFVGGDGPRFGAMVSLKDYPARSTPGMLDALLRLPVDMTMTESFSFVERQVALERMGLALRRLRAADDDAYSLRDELAAARDQVGANRAAYGDHHLTLLVRTETLEALDLAVAEVRSALTEAGAVAVREDVNLEPAFWAQMPGNFAFIARRALISTANFASFSSFHNHAGGQADGNHWGPAVTVLETTAFGPYHFNFHSGDLGNFTLIGPSGSGKTVLLTFLLAQARKFAPRTFYFDKDRGAELFIRATGGNYEMLRPGEPTGLNPLLLPDTPANRAFLAEWLALLVGVGTGGDAGEERALIVDAVDANFAQPPEHRRLLYLRELFVGARRPTAGDLAARLAPWIEGGEYGWLFDNPVDRLVFEGDMFGFDMTRMLDTPISRTPAMLYLFHRIEQQLDGSPAIIVIDEGWKALDDDVFVRRIRDWEKTIRKRNGIVGFATQSASDALESRISSAIVEQAATQIFLPNPKARVQDYVEGFGLSEHEFNLVRTLPDTSHCFLVKQHDHSVVARLDLASMPDILRVLAGTERSVRQCDAIRAEVGDAPQQWLPRFLGEPSGSERAGR